MMEQAGEKGEKTDNWRRGQRCVAERRALLGTEASSEGVGGSSSTGTGALAP